MTQQKDELERKYLEMKESCESNVNNGQEELATLCREFANEKADLVAKHEQEVKEMESQVKLFTQQLADERRANERTTELLQSERDQHQHALVAHQEIIAKFEKTSAMKEEQATKMVSCVKLEEVMQDHQVEINRLKQKHHHEMESVQRDLQTKLDQMLSEKHKFAERSSMCSELERLEESVQVERQEMHERIHELQRSVRA
uniref:Protein FAM184A/B N-terminal domain-containing protein n=1 Tax=Ciona savignyi TaxID=51511 RepID=H2YJ55_CIOSA